VIPSQGASNVAPGVAKSVGHVNPVPPGISGEVYSVFIRKAVIASEVQIIEIEAVPANGCIRDKRKKEVRIGTAAGDEHRSIGAILENFAEGSLYGETAGKKSYTASG